MRFALSLFFAFFFWALGTWCGYVAYTDAGDRSGYMGTCCVFLWLFGLACANDAHEVCSKWKP